VAAAVKDQAKAGRAAREGTTPRDYVRTRVARQGREQQSERASREQRREKREIGWSGIEDARSLPRTNWVVVVVSTENKWKAQSAHVRSAGLERPRRGECM